MKKKQKQSQAKENSFHKEENTPQLQDMLDSDIFKKLQAKKQELKKEEQVKQEEAEKKKIKERKEREKNKSFEELLNESSIDWKNYK